MNSLKKPYERQDSESPAAWAGFVAYRDLGIARTLVDAARKLGKEDKYARTLSNWAGPYKWQYRIQEWDAEIDRRVRRSQLCAAEKMREDHLALVDKLHDITKTELAKLDWVVKNQEDLNLSPKEIREYVDSIVKLGRLLNGEPTEISKVSVSERDELKDMLSNPEIMNLADQILELKNATAQSE